MLYCPSVVVNKGDQDDCRGTVGSVMPLDTTITMITAQHSTAHACAVSGLVSTGHAAGQMDSATVFGKHYEYIT